jgi:hypothetical protein
MIEMVLLPVGTRVLGQFRPKSDIIIDATIEGYNAAYPGHWYIVTGVVQHLSDKGKIRTREVSGANIKQALTVPYKLELYDELLQILRRIYEAKVQRKADLERISRLLKGD